MITKEDLKAVIEAAAAQTLQEHYEVMIPMSWLFHEQKPRYSYHSCGPVYPERTPRSPKQR